MIPILRGDRPVDRLLNFSDAVVAVAITILALPLVDIGGPQEGQTVWAVLHGHYGQIMTFASTFLVVGMLWTVHNRIMNYLDAYDGTVFWLNMLWLIGFVFLPWPSSMFSGGEDVNSSAAGAFHSDGTGVLYWMTLAYISLMGSIMSLYVARNLDLVNPGDRNYVSSLRRARGRWRGLTFFFIFVIAALLTLIYSWLGFFALFLIIPARRFLDVKAEEQPTKNDGETTP